MCGTGTGSVHTPAIAASLAGRVSRGKVTYRARLTCSGLYSSSASASAVLHRENIVEICTTSKSSNSKCHICYALLKALCNAFFFHTHVNGSERLHCTRLQSGSAFQQRCGCSSAGIVSAPSPFLLCCMR